MLFLLTLPFRIAFGLFFGLLLLPFALLFLPFLLLRFAVKAVVMLIALPIALLAMGGVLLVAMLAVGLALAIPLLPFAFIALCIWAIARASSRPVLSR